jgi:hypothetical protein
MSFGFKYGVPVDADFVADVRFLPNPFWIPELRDLRGARWWNHLDLRVARQYLAEQEAKAPPAEPAPRAKQSKPSLAARQADELIASLRQATAALLEADKAFDPSQPRYPAGDPRGGQWRPEGGAGQGTAPAEDPKGGEWTAHDVGPGEELYSSSGNSLFVDGWMTREQAEKNGVISEILAPFRLTLADVERSSTLEGLRARIYFSDEEPGKLGVTVKYEQFTTGYPVGEQTWWLDNSNEDEIVVHADLLTLEPDYQDKGISESLMGRQFELAVGKQYDRIKTHADISIGKYAWAKANFQYVNRYAARSATERFVDWCRRRNVELDQWPKFYSPQDVINFDAPGIKIPHTEIDNEDIKPRDYGLGAAFMLDEDGHGSWDAVYDLRAMWEEKT